jgi:DNA-binding GntR family transcriptional regulator
VIAGELRDQLSDGRLRSGSVLPTVSQLAARYLVSRQSARIALRQLAADGLLVRVPGRGTLAASLSREAVPAGLSRNENR